MSRKRKFQLFALSILLFSFVGVYTLYAWTPLPVEDDPLVRMPGTQPNQVTLERPNRCLNCHSGYDEEIEPGFNWQGSMMAQSARDFLFWACMVVAGQDSTWAAGRPNAVDICERCHFPKGWLEGRSDPTNASAMTGADYDGVQCDFCHAMYDPFFETTHAGTREGDDWLDYWDETNASDTPSEAAAETTYAEDGSLAEAIMLFSGEHFYGDGGLPVNSAYVESGAGQYFVSPNGEKRASFADATGRHAMLYSRYHKSRYFCDACHDVSNPVLANLAFDGTPPGDGTTVLTTESDPAYSYYHVERTFSEFMLSAYSEQGGAPGIGPFAPDQFTTSYPNDYIAKCQDCHMPDGVGKGADLKDAIVRPSGSAEHPNSGQPVHDLTGGNAWVSYVLASSTPGSPNYDATNDQLLNQGPGLLTLDMSQGDGFDPVALLAGVDRAQQQLQLAAAIEDLGYDAATGELFFRIQNHTGHKLISGFPEGRRMFVNIKAYAGGSLIYEVNPYDQEVATLKGLPPEYSPNSPPLGPNETYVDELVYEMHPGSLEITGEQETFHFALATGRYKDNRIPPQGFRIDDAPARLSQPVWHGQDAPEYFTSEEYAGGYDEIHLADYGFTIPGADEVEIQLYYQTTSREYIEFLRDEINGTASTLPSEAYIAQTDPFFSQLKAWGDTIWQLWDHNKGIPGAAPLVMTEASIAITQLPAFSIGDATATESDGSITFPVSLSSTSDLDADVYYETSDGTAAAGDDYDAISGTLTILAGETTESIVVDIVDNAVYEADETFTVDLSAPTNATLDKAQAIGTILDDDDPPVIAFSNPTYSVGEAGDPATITVTLTGATDLTATVDYATGDGTAVHGEDYLAASGTLTFTPGSTNQTFTVTLLADDLHEAQETVNLTLSNATSATLDTDSATLAILDDDEPPIVSIGDATATEGDGSITLPVSLSSISDLDAEVYYETNDGTAAAGDDYDAISGTLTILAGDTIGQIEVALIDDVQDEGPEIFTVDLSNPVNATLENARATATILDDDGSPEISFSSATYSTGEAEGPATITVTLTGATAATVVVDYTTATGTGASTATAGEDYTTVSGTLTFVPGTAALTFTVPITDDLVYERDETVDLILSGVLGADLGLSSAVLTILNDDDPPEIAFSNTTYNAGEADGPATITVTLTGATALTATVDYATGGGTAVQGEDYLAASGTLTLTPGTTNQTFTVTLLADDLYETQETVNLTLSNATSATVDTDSATLAILDDDDPPAVSIGDATGTESDGSITFPVSLSLISDLDADVYYETNDGTAAAGDDYDAISGTLTILAGETTESIVVDIVDNTVYEAGETFTVDLSAPTNATLDKAQAIGTILDDDDPPVIAFSSPTYSVGESEGPATITVTLTGATALTATVDYATADGSATQGEDYLAASDTLTFTPGITSRTFAITILNDELSEPDQTVGLLLSSPGHAILGANNAAILTILNDDAPDNHRLYLPLVHRSWP